MRKIIAIGKSDAYYDDRKNLIGVEVSIDDANHEGRGWYSNLIGFFGPVDGLGYRDKRYFHRVRLSKEY